MNGFKMDRNARPIMTINKLTFDSSRGLSKYI